MLSASYPVIQRQGYPSPVWFAHLAYQMDALNQDRAELHREILKMHMRDLQEYARLDVQAVSSQTPGQAVPCMIGASNSQAGASSPAQALWQPAMCWQTSPPYFPERRL